MPSINKVDVLTIMYVIVDDWYQTTGQYMLDGKAGAKPVFSASELLTLMVAQDFLHMRGRRRMWRISGRTTSGSFRRWWNRASTIGGCWRRCGRWVRQLGAWADKQLLLDTKPVRW